MMLGRVNRLFLQGISMVILSVVAMISVACTEKGGAEYGDYTEKELETTLFTNIQVSYNGGDAISKITDGWVIKLYTDMEIDEVGNPIGPGEVMQLWLNVKYDEDQVANLKKLVGTYKSQSNSGDFGSGTFVWGQMVYLDLPNGKIALPDATFYASVAEGTTEMDVDLLDDGTLYITANEDGTYTIEGVLVGKQCRKRSFRWQGAIEPKSNVKPSVPNSTLISDVQLANFTKLQLQDRGDYFYVKDESYRDFLIFLAEEGISFEWGKPVGSGDVLRLELLVPWSTDVEDGIPAGEYKMLVRNEDTSFNREDIVPFSAIPGLPNAFTVPYWSGIWYVNYVEGAWSESYARIEKGTIRVERGTDGSHRFICNLQDCSSPAFEVKVDATIESDKLIIY